MGGFVHLHCHSCWSLLDGAIPAEALAHVAAELGFQAVALTDHDALTGAVRFSTACRDAGIKPLFGAELTVRSDDGTGHPYDGRLPSSAPLRSAANPSAEADGFSARLPPGGRPSQRESREEAVARTRSSTPVEHVTVIARDKTGYGNLCRLISEAHLTNERGRPATTFEAIAERSQGLFVLSGCARGEVARLAAAGLMPDAIEAARRWRRAIGEGYRIEVFDHRRYGARILRDRLLQVAREAKVKAVATNDVHYAIPQQAGTHEVLHAINEIVPLSRAQALRGNSEYYLKDAGEMRALFADVPELADETLRIAEACDFDLDLGSYHFPEVPMPPGETATGLLARRCYEGAHRHFVRLTRDVEERLQHELRLIFKMGFAAYFLLVADIVEHARNVLGVCCACRGSAAGSLVCYVLGISDVDPVRYDLLFERFMNAKREELPDIDIDVESHRREEVLEHILDRYGSEQTALCCMVDTFRARGAIRDVGKALGIPEGEIDVVAKAFPHIGAAAIPHALERLPELKGTNLQGAQLTQLFELCEAIGGLPRHLALHPSGVVLSSADLAERVPMQRSYGGFTMLQADKDDVEQLGLAKLDILGVRMLSAISHAVAEVERARGERVDLDALPHDDEQTFRLIRSSRTLGCFQIESPGQRDLLARFQPHRFEDLIIDISLFRPGPVKSDMVTPFLQRRHGFSEITYAHPSLEPILAETNGVVVYHEQVIRVIAAVTGCALDDADYVRRHLEPGAETNGVAAPIDIVPPDDDVARWFKAGAQANGFTKQQADALWKEVFSFASFGFCKSHAAAFALPTYLSAWLKAHYPAEFLAGVLTHDPGMYPRRSIVADARQLGIPILPIDVNASDAVYRVEPLPASAVASDPVELGDLLREEGRPPGGTLAEKTSALADDFGADRSGGDGGRRPSCERASPAAREYGIRLALSEVRGISDTEIDSILYARGDGGFVSLEDLWRRTDLSRPVLENLVELGALDSIEPHRARRELLWRAIELSSECKPRAGLQLLLPLDEPIQQTLPGLPGYSAAEETEAEVRISGIDARRHLMELYRPLCAQLGCVPSADLRKHRNNSEVWITGVKISTQTPAIRSGQRIIFLTLDDLDGPMDVTIFERVQSRCAWTVFHSWLLVVRGELRKRGGASLRHATDPENVGITIVAEEVFDLAELASDANGGCSLNDAIERQRRRQNGFVREESSRPPGRLWHASGGSAGG